MTSYAYCGTRPDYPTEADIKREPMSDREIAIAAVIELYRDRAISADEARLILRGLGASEAQISRLSHW